MFSEGTDSLVFTPDDSKAVLQWNKSTVKWPICKIVKRSLISIPMLQNSEEAEVCSHERESRTPSGRISPRHREGTMWLWLSCAMMLQSSLYWQETQTESYRCCPASQRAVTFSMALTAEQEICRKSTGPQKFGARWPGLPQQAEQGKPAPVHSKRGCAEMVAFQHHVG